MFNEKKTRGFFIFQIYFACKVGGGHLLRVIGDGGKLQKNWGCEESGQYWKYLLYHVILWFILDIYLAS